jgi:hypothetical protein
MTPADNRSLISKSVMMIRIDIHHAEEELDQHAVHATPGVPTKLKSGPYSGDEVLAPSDAQPGRHPGLPHSPSNKPPWSREVRLNELVTRILGLSGPIKTWHAACTKQSLPSRPKWCGPESTQAGATTLKPQNSHNPLLVLPFRVNHFHLIALPSHIHNTRT